MPFRTRSSGLRSQPLLRAKADTKFAASYSEYRTSTGARSHWSRVWRKTTAAGPHPRAQDGNGQPALNPAPSHTKQLGGLSLSEPLQDHTQDDHTTLRHRPSSPTPSFQCRDSSQPEVSDSTTGRGDHLDRYADRIHLPRLGWPQGTVQQAAARGEEMQTGRKQPLFRGSRFGAVTGRSYCLNGILGDSIGPRQRQRRASCLA